MEIKVGTRIVTKMGTMVVTGENAKNYLGYFDYRGKRGNDIRFPKERLNDPFYTNGMQIIND